MATGYAAALSSDGSLTVLYPGWTSICRGAAARANATARAYSDLYEQVAAYCRDCGRHVTQLADGSAASVLTYAETYLVLAYLMEGSIPPEGEAIRDGLAMVRQFRQRARETLDLRRLTFDTSITAPTDSYQYEPVAPVRLVRG